MIPHSHCVDTSRSGAPSRDSLLSSAATQRGQLAQFSSNTEGSACSVQQQYIRTEKPCGVVVGVIRLCSKAWVRADCSRMICMLSSLVLELSVQQLVCNPLDSCSKSTVVRTGIGDP
jgi:hypothetical protein